MVIKPSYYTLGSREARRDRRRYGRPGMKIEFDLDWPAELWEEFQRQWSAGTQIVIQPPGWKPMDDQPPIAIKGKGAREAE